MFSDAFAMFYGAINIGASLSSAAMPKLRDNYGYSVAFLFPAGLMIFALTMFAVGKKYYAVETIDRTPRRHSTSRRYATATRRRPTSSTWTAAARC